MSSEHSDQEPEDNSPAVDSGEKEFTKLQPKVTSKLFYKPNKYIDSFHVRNYFIPFFFRIETVITHGIVYCLVR